MRINTGIEEDKVRLNVINPCGDMVSDRVEAMHASSIPSSKDRSTSLATLRSGKLLEAWTEKVKMSGLIGTAGRSPIPLMNIQINNHQTIDLSVGQKCMGSNCTDH